MAIAERLGIPAPGATRPVSEETQQALAAVRDCVDAVLACDREDPAALVTVVARIRNPHGSFMLLAAIAGGLLDRQGLRGTAAREALREVAMKAADGLLDLGYTGR
jgi:hypothetical protein